MSQEGSIKFRQAKVDAELDEHGKEWAAINAPGPKPMYRMNDDEFMHHVHVLVITEILQEKLGITPEEIHLRLTEKFLEESRKMLEILKQHQRNQIRNGIIIPRPKIDPII